MNKYVFGYIGKVNITLQIDILIIAVGSVARLSEVNFVNQKSTDLKTGLFIR